MREIYAKITGLSDLDWSELAEQSGMDIHPDQLRKMGQGIRLAYEAGVLDLAGEAGAPMPDPQELQKLRDLRRELHEGQRAGARSEALRETVLQAAAALPPITVALAEQPDTAAGELRTLVVCVADCHYGAEWAITGLRGEVVNAYSPEVFEARMGALLQEVIGILGREDIRDVTLLLCGDSLDGMLRQSQLLKLRYGMVESCMRFAEYMAQWTARLAEHASVRVYGVDGNHTEVRPLGSKRGEFENENLEKIILWFLAERFAGIPQVEVSEAKPMHYLQVQGYSILLSHDTDAKTMEAAARQAMLLYGERVDYMVTGHRHREQEAVSGYNETGSALVLRVPSICGADRYAQKLGFGGKPGALAMVLEAGYGRRCVYPIAL